MLNKKGVRVDAVTRALRGIGGGPGMTAKEAIEAWDEGNALRSVEMGGIGPGYEQTIQIIAIESLRVALAEEERINAAIDYEVFKKLRDAVIHKIDNQVGGVTGAQAGAASNLAWNAYRMGWGGMLESAKKNKLEDRTIMISKFFPKAP